MRLTTRSVALEVRPGRRAALSHLIDGLRGDSPGSIGGRPGAYDRILAAMPTLHFMSLSVFDSADYDPLLIIEVNFDGPSGPFWGQLQAVLGDELREMLRCCKTPLDRWAGLFEAVTAAGSHHDIAPYLEVRALRPRVYFHGTRGMPRARIEREARLFRAVQRELGDGGGAWGGQPAAAIRNSLRQRLAPDFPWLNLPAPVRVPLRERAATLAQLLLLLVAVVYLLCVPGILMSAIVRPDRLALSTAIVALPVWAFLHRLARPLPGVATARNVSLARLARRRAVPIVIALAVLYLICFPINAGFAALSSGESYRASLPVGARQFAWGMVWLLAIELPLLLIWLRWLERRDSSLSQPQTDPARRLEMAQVEDWVPQNHMGSIVSLRPQLIRRALVYVGEPAVHLALRTFVRDGYLGAMRTIHCAHWALVNNGSRLLFLSNFDLSWETYFDDFIEKAHEGLTLVWGSSVGFPPTTMLIEDGAAHGRQFKEWARHSMAVSRFWVSAYPDLTVDQIERNNRIAGGLRGSPLSEKKAMAWATDL